MALLDLKSSYLLKGYCNVCTAFYLVNKIEFVGVIVQPRRRITSTTTASPLFR